MDDNEILDFLEELAESLGLEISHEPIRLDEELGTRPGGFCQFKGRRLIIVNPHVRVKEKIRILSEGIKHCDLEQIFIRPIIRELLHTIEIGLHTQFIGEIVDVKGEDSILGENGVPEVEKVVPFFYSPENRAYYRVGEYLGKTHSTGRAYSTRETI